MKRGGGASAILIGALHKFVLLLLTLAIVIFLAFCGLAFRLSRGPLQIPYLASALATAASGQGVNVHITDAALAWAGYRQGGGTPLYLQLDKITASNAEGVALAEIPDARLVFLPSALLGSRAPILVNSSDVRFAGSDVAVGLRAAIRLSPGFSLSQADLFVTLGPGRAGAGGTSEAITGGAFALHLTPHDVLLSNGQVNLAPSGGSAPVVKFAGAGHLGNVWTGQVELAADKVQAADLPVYWPPLLGKQARHWVTTNITGGLAHDARFTLQLSAPRNLSAVTLVNATGGFAGDDLVLTWLPHAQPITQLFGKLALLDQDTIFITADRARLGGINVNSGTMKITGVSKKDQTGIVSVVIGGRIADALAVLNAPPLNLLRQAPPELVRSNGNFTAAVTTTLPLKNKLKLAEIALGVDAKITDATVKLPLDGLGFSQGVFAVHASTTALAMTGTAMLAGQPAMLSAQADFTKAQPLRRAEMKTALGPAALQQLGLAAETGLTDQVNGAVPIDLAVNAAPNGAAELATLQADLTGAELGVPVLGWAKQAGAPGALKIAATIGGGGDFNGIDRVDVTGPALAIHGTTAGGSLYLKQILIGRTVAQGRVTPPAKGQPWRVDLAGPMLDLRAILTPAKGKQAAEETPSPGAPSGPAWQAQLKFASINLAAPPAPGLLDFSFTGHGKGSGVLAADAGATSAAGVPMTISIKPVSADGARRSFTLTAGDGGNLLRALAAFDAIQNGVLSVYGTYGAGAAFTGKTTLTRFRLLNAPAIGKVLQTLTVYGAAEAASGPGLLFDRLVAPFSISHQTLSLINARAYSASLGFTAAGTIGLADGSVNLQTTIIPAYALNTLPSRIPVIGKLFSAEKGGGLIAIRASITGQLTKPTVRLNPLSALTPGILRDVFGQAPEGKSK